jgi:stage II sporulation protein M
MGIRNIFISLSILFVLSCYFGYFFAGIFPDYTKKEIDTIREWFENLNLREIPPITVFAIILLNNSIKSFVAMTLGVLLGIPPILFVAINGAVIGIFAKVVGDEIGTLTFLAKILPHGIVEIPAIIIASSYGVWLGIQFVKDRKNIDKHMRHATNRFLKVVLPMLTVAAVIETVMISFIQA